MKFFLYDLPPFGPSIITRACWLDFGVLVLRWVQARQTFEQSEGSTPDALAVA